MQYRFLGTTGLKISELVLGTMSFGGPADEEASAEMYRASRELGINTFDCANVYNDGRSEEILGDLIAEERRSVVVTSKAYFPMGDGENDQGGSRHHLVHAVEDSLRRLNTDYIDLYFLHRFDPFTPLRETLYGIERLIRSGKIRYWGVSNFAAWQIMKGIGVCDLEGWSRLACIQPMYNLVKRQAEVEILPLAESEQVGVMAYSPLGAGLLTGKYGADDRPESGRLVENESYQTRYGDSWMYEVAERFSDFASDRGVHPVSLAVAWVLAHPGVTAPIIGGRHLGQLTDSLASVEIEMDAELRAQITALSPDPPPATDRTEEQTSATFDQR